MGNHGDSVMLKRLFFIKISIKYGDMDSSVSRDYFQSMLEGIFFSVKERLQKNSNFFSLIH